MKKETIFILLSYLGILLILLLINMLTVASGTDSIFEWILIAIVVSAAFMLRQERVIRIPCFCVICLLLLGLIQEQETHLKLLVKKMRQHTEQQSK